MKLKKQIKYYYSTLFGNKISKANLFLLHLLTLNLHLMKYIIPFIFIVFFLLPISLIAQEETADEKIDRENYSKIYSKLQKFDDNIVEEIENYQKEVITKKGEGLSLMLYGIHYSYYNMNSSDSCFNLAYDIFIENNYKKDANAARINISILKTLKGEYDEAIKLLKESIISHELDSNYQKIGVCQTNIASIFFTLENYKKSKIYHLKSLESYSKSNDIQGIGIAQKAIGHIEFFNNNDSLALDYYKLAEYNFSKINDTLELATVHENIGELELFHNNNIEKATYHYQYSENLLLAANNYCNTIYSKTGIADCYAKENKFNKASEIYKKAYQISIDCDIAHIKVSLLKNIYLCEKELKNYKKAFQYQEKYIEMNDSIFNIEKIASLEEIETKYETEKKEKALLIKENQILAQKAEISNEQSKNRLFIIGLAGLVILLIASAYFYFIQKKTNKELSLLNNFKNQVFKVIGHDLRMPIASIVSSNATDDTKHKADNALSILDELLMWGTKTNTKNEIVNVGRLLHKIEEELIEQIQAKNLDITIKSNNFKNYKTNKNEITIILRNLMSNAIKYSKNDSAIDINLNHNNIIFSNEIDKNIKSGTQKGLEIVKFLVNKNKLKFETKLGENFVAKLSIYEN